MGKIGLIIVTAILGLWLIYAAVQIKKAGKTRNGSLGQRVRFEDVEDKDYFVSLTTIYHGLIGAGFVAVAVAAWLISNPTIVLFLYLIYAAGINFARFKVETLLMDAK
jgi:hypothetical protein